MILQLDGIHVNISFSIYVYYIKVDHINPLFFFLIPFPLLSFPPFSLQLVNAYVMTSREPPLNTAACRLLLDIMPGLETAVVFQEKVLGSRKVIV